MRYGGKSMKCDTCGSDRAEDVLFCSVCGSKEESKATPSKFWGRKTWMRIGIIAAVLLFIGLLCYVFRWQLIRTVAPEKYLQMSVEKTTALMSKGTQDPWQLNSFTDVPVSHEFNVNYPDLESQISGTIMYDRLSEKARIDFNTSVEGQKSENLMLYISPEICALSVPDMLQEADMVTISPATFTEDWNEYLKDDEAIPFLDLEEQIHALFGKANQTDKKDDAQREIDQLVKNNKEDAKFSYIGTGKEDIMGKEMSLTEMTYRYGEDEMNDLFQTIIEIRADQFESYLTQVIDGNYDEFADGMSEGFDEVMDVISGVKLEDDVVVHFYVDQNNIVRKITIEEFDVSYEDFELSMEIDMVLGGGPEAPADNMEINIVLSAEGDDLNINIVKETEETKGVHTGSLDIELSADKSEILFMEAEYEWDSTKTSDDNLDASISFGSEGYKIEFALTGLLVADKDEISLSDGIMTMKSPNEEKTEIEFTYKLTKIDSSDITIDTKDSISLFDLMEQQENGSMI
jgi:hypothetical protein